jgi:hypothetical protein
MDRGEMYCEYKDNISNLLNSSLHESVILECVITLIMYEGHSESKGQFARKRTASTLNKFFL